MSDIRMRLVGWDVRPVVMADDGDDLTPLSVQPQHIPAASWQEFKDGGDQAALAKLRDRIEAGPARGGIMTSTAAGVTGCAPGASEAHPAPPIPRKGSPR